MIRPGWDCVGVDLDGVAGDPRGHVPGGVGALGGVLGQVAGDGGVGDRLVAAHPQRAQVELFTPADGPPVAVGGVRLGPEPGRLDGLAQQVGEHEDGGPLPAGR